MTLQKTFDNFILSRRLAGLSEKTTSAYQQFVDPFVRFAGPDRDFQTLLQKDIENYLFELLSRPLSKSSRATYIRHIKIFLKWAAAEYTAAYCAQKIKVPKASKREVRIYTPEDVRIIFQTVSCESEWMTCRNRLMIALMYDSGLRQGELCSLKRDWIIPDERRMKVRGKGDKERTVPLGDISLKYLRQYYDLCPFKSELVFVNRHGEALTCNAVKLMVTKLAGRLPFELSSHKLRHNFATNYCLDQYEQRGQIDIFRLQYLMGHESVETTRKYLHFANELIAGREHISHLDKLLCG